VDIAQEVIDAVGQDGARQLVNVLAAPDENRADLIARMFQRPELQTLGETLAVLDEDEYTRMQLVVALRERLKKKR
jgi:hypothetical protein